MADPRVILHLLPEDDEAAAAILRAHAPEGTVAYVAGEWSREALHHIVSNHGFTVKDHFGDAPTSGYMVSIDKTSEQVFPLASITAADIATYRARHASALAAPNAYLGAWVEGGQAFLDVSTHVPTYDQAEALARAHQQLAVFDLTTGTTIFIDQQRAAAGPRLYLRVGDWHPSEQSRNYATGVTEIGLSVYDLDAHGQPVVPPEGEWAAADLSDRLDSDDPKYLVTGEEVGVGGDGEPLLRNVRRVGMWPDDFAKHGALNSARAHSLYGAGHLDAMFPDGAPQTPMPFGMASRTRDRPQFWDQDAVLAMLRDPNRRNRLEPFDPRELEGTQSNVTRQGVAHYFGDAYRQTGQTFRDQGDPGNRYPVIYVRADGRKVIVSGHHRAAAALLKGEPLMARRVDEVSSDRHASHHPVPVPRRGHDGPAAHAEGGLGLGGGGVHPIGEHRRAAARALGLGPAGDGRTGDERADAGRPRALREDGHDAARDLSGLPTGLSFRVNQGEVSAVADGAEVGFLEWDVHNRVHMVWVHPEYQRRGIATALFAKAREVNPDIQHSTSLTEPGRSWSQHVGALDPGWRPTKGMFSPGKPTLDPRVFDVATETMRPEVCDAVLRPLRVFWDAKYPGWESWARVYLAGSAASYWYDSDGDFDTLIGIDVEALRQARPANIEVSEADIVAHLDRELKEVLDPTTSAMVFAPGEKPMEVTYFVNPDSFNIADIKPYAAYAMWPDEGWVVHPPVLPADWGPEKFAPEVWQHFDQIAREAEGVLDIGDPAARHQACVALFDRLHSWRQSAYSNHGHGWLDVGNVYWQALSQTPGRLLQRLYAVKHDPAFAVTASATLRFKHEDQDEEWPHIVHAFHPEHGWIGSLSYDEHTGEIMDVGIKGEHQRKGYATQLLEEARRVQPNVHHSHNLTEDGEAWSKKTAGPVRDRIIPAMRRMVPPGELRKPRPVELDRGAEEDLRKLPGDIRNALVRAVHQLEDGKADLEAKARQLAGAYSLRLSNAWRALFYLGEDLFWHLFAITDHDYGDVSRRFASQYTVEVEWAPYGNPDASGGIDLGQTQTRQIVVDADSDHEATLQAAQIASGVAPGWNERPGRYDYPVNPIVPKGPKGMVTKVRLVRGPLANPALGLPNVDARATLPPAFVFGDVEVGSRQGMTAPADFLRSVGGSGSSSSEGVVTRIAAQYQNEFYPAVGGGKYHRINRVVETAQCNGTIMLDTKTTPITVDKNQERVHPIVCKRCLRLGGNKTADYRGPTQEDSEDIAHDNAAIYLTGNPPQGSDLVREFAVTPAATDFFAGEADDLSRAYRDMPILDPSVVPLWQEMAVLNAAQAAALRSAFTVIVHDDLDPYETAEEMHADIDRGIYQVTSLHSHHPVWTPEQNVDFRIVHDLMGHGVANSDFSLKGEVQAYQAQCKVVPTHLWPVLFTEIIAQASYANTHHLFGEQKVGLIPLTQAQIDAQVGKIMDAADPAYDALHYSASAQGVPWSRVAKPNMTTIFSGTGKDNYTRNDPYIAVMMYVNSTGMRNGMDFRAHRAPVPWEGDLERAIRQAEDNADRYWNDSGEPWTRWRDLPDTKFYLIAGSGEKAELVGVADHWGAPWRSTHDQVGSRGPWPEFLALVRSNRKVAWEQFCMRIADSQPPGFNLHPLAPRGSDKATIYRGITLKEDDDPLTSTNAERIGGGAGIGSSWTLDFTVAKRIAERGGAGFSGTNYGPPGVHQRKVIPRSSSMPSRPVVLRAEVDLSAEGFSLLSDGRMYYAEEQEVDVKPDTSVRLTGYMEAEAIPVDPREYAQAKAEAEKEMAEQGFSFKTYDVRFQWPGRFTNTNTRRTAKVS